MSDRVAIMNNGQLQQYGSPSEVYHKPTNAFVAGFIGSPSMNLLPVTITHENGVSALQGESFRFTPKAPQLQSILRSAPHQRLILGIRHTAIPLLPTTEPDSIPVQIYTIEPTGDLTFVHVQIGEQLIIASTDNPDFQAQMGDKLAVKLDENRLHLFDAETTLALTN